MIRKDYPSKHEFALAKKSGLERGDLRDCFHLQGLDAVTYYTFNCAQNSFHSSTIRETSSSPSLGSVRQRPVVSCPKDCTYFQDRKEAEREYKRKKEKAAEAAAEAAAAKAKQEREAEATRKNQERIQWWKAVPIRLIRFPGFLLKTILEDLPSEKLKVTVVIVGGVIFLVYVFGQSPQLIQLAMEVLKKLPW